MKSIFKHKPFRIQRIALSALMGLTIIVTGCSRSMTKPELHPEYQTSSAIATFLRSATKPGLTEYPDFAELVQAKADLDPNLADIDEIPQLATDPDGFAPTFQVGLTEVMVSYSDTEDSDRKFIVYGNFSDDPNSLLEDFTAEAYFTKEKIGAEDFYVLDVDEATDLEAYTIRGNWFIHLTGSALAPEEFKTILGTVELSALTPDNAE